MATWEETSESLGLTVDQFKYITCLLANVILGYILSLTSRFLPEKTKHVLSIAISIYMCEFCLGAYSWIHSLITILVTYVLVKFCPPAKLPTIVFVWALGYLSLSHIYRQYTDYLGWTLDFTAPQMLLTIRLTSFAYCYSDGQKLKRMQEKDVEELKKHFYPRQLTYAVREVPSLIEFMGFCYFFPTFLAGPTFEYNTYKQYIDLSLFSKEGKKIPNTLPAIGWGFVKLLFIVPGLYVLLFVKEINFIDNPNILTAPVIQRTIYTYIFINLVRHKYYFGWFLGEISCRASGIAYNRNGDNITWDGAVNVNPLRVEFAISIHEMLSNWNICTHHWLKNYVYLRMVPVGTRPGTAVTIVTFIVSAFWHGFYPGYYIFFVLLAFVQEIAKDTRRLFRPYFVSRDANGKEKRNYFYDFVTYLLVFYCVSYMATSFVLLSWERTLYFFQQTSYHGLIFVIANFLLFKVVSVIFPPKRTPRVTKVE